MEARDMARGKAAGFDTGPAQKAKNSASGRAPAVDRLELNRQWAARQAEEERALEGAALYEKAAKERRQSGVPDLPDSGVGSAELEAMSEELKLQQKCQDIAALMMVDELEISLNKDQDKDEEV